jgi:hypothetical protein
MRTPQSWARRRAECAFGRSRCGTQPEQDAVARHPGPKVDRKRVGQPAMSATGRRLCSGYYTGYVVLNRPRKHSVSKPPLRGCGSGRPDVRYGSWGAVLILHNPAALSRSRSLLRRRTPARSNHNAMSATPAAHASAPHPHVASPNGTSKLSQHSPDAHSWSDEGSSGEDAVERSQSGTSGKRKRPVSVSCETYVSAYHIIVLANIDSLQVQDAKSEVRQRPSRVW